PCDGTEGVQGGQTGQGAEGQCRVGPARCEDVLLCADVPDHARVEGSLDGAADTRSQRRHHRGLPKPPHKTAPSDRWRAHPQRPPRFRGFSDAGPGCATAWRLAERAQTSGARLALAIVLLMVDANKRSGGICSDIVLCSLIGTCRAPVLCSCQQTCLSC